MPRAFRRAGGALLLALEFFGCANGRGSRSEEKLTDSFDARSQQESLLLRRFPDSVAMAFRYHSSLRDSGVTVVRDAASWEAMWRSLTAKYTPARPLPTIDFAKEMAIVAALGERSTGGYSIRIEAVLDRDTYGETHVRRTAPGRGCGVPGMQTAPADVVVVPRRNWEVRATMRDSVVRCAPS